MRPPICSLLAATYVSTVCATDFQYDHAHHVAARGASLKSGCDVLAVVAEEKTFTPGSNVYEYENTQFWSNTQLLDPGCIFRPESPGDVAVGLKALVNNQTPFAVRGGGHMGIKGANNIDAPGVLIVLSNLTYISLNADKSLLTLGPGYKWGPVYSYLAEHDLAVAGGRLGPVGVPGLLLAGGINFWGNQYGFSADTVLSYEVAKADGSIVTASAEENKDLFWALKGGSSNFGIVTSFEMKTIESAQVWAGTLTFGQESIGAVYEAIAEYAAAPTDPKAHVVPAVVPSSAQSDPDVIAVIMFYDSATIARPACFDMFFAIPTVADTTDFKTVSQFADENGALVVDHINDVFVAGTISGSNYDELLRGIQITNDTFYEALNDLYTNIPAEDISILQLDWQPITKTWIEAGLKINPAGSPILGGLSEYETKTYLAYAQVVEWLNTQGDHDEFVAGWIETTTSAINAALEKEGLWAPFNYMGDAAGFQDIYDGYGAENKQALLDISTKYDPQRVFQKLMPGGFKIGV